MEKIGINKNVFYNLIAVLVHDNACKFAAFVRNRKDTTTIMNHLSKLDFRVDRHHFKNHVGSTCKRENNPDTCEELNDVNTSIMEQVNSWFGRFRHSARYMTGPRFYLYLLVACHLNNQFRRYKQSTRYDDACENENNQAILEEINIFD